jgi:hypothetical protein
LAVVDRADAVPDLETDVPHERQEAFEMRLPARRFALRQQDQNVDIGAQIQLATPVAADGDERDLAGKFAEVCAPGALEQCIDEACAIANEAFDRFVIEESLLEASVAFGQRGAKRSNVLALSAQRGLQ